MKKIAEETVIKIDSKWNIKYGCDKTVFEIVYRFAYNLANSIMGRIAYKYL